MSVLDKYLSRQYNIKTYNCLHFVIDVWLEITGNDLTPVLNGVLTYGARIPTRKVLRSFTRITSPVTPCLVFMHRPRMAPHIGVYIEGKVFHIQPKGVEYQPIKIASLYFKEVRYYLCPN